MSLRTDLSLPPPRLQLIPQHNLDCMDLVPLMHCNPHEFPEATECHSGEKMSPAFARPLRHLVRWVDEMRSRPRKEEPIASSCRSLGPRSHRTAMRWYTTGGRWAHSGGAQLWESCSTFTAASVADGDRRVQHPSSGQQIASRLRSTLVPAACRSPCCCALLCHTLALAPTSPSAKSLHLSLARHLKTPFCQPADAPAVPRFLTP